MRRSKFLIFNFFVFYLISVNAQDPHIISGVVRDAKTKKKLEFANCYIKSKNIGTYTSDKGQFVLTIDSISKEDSCIFSYVGYKTIVIPLLKIATKKRFVVDLSTNINDIAEVSIKADKINIKKIIRHVITNYLRTKPKEPHISSAYYYETAKQDSKYIMFTESMGYSIYLGKPVGVAPLSNYKFFYYNTRKAIPNKLWVKYATSIDTSLNNVLPSASNGLNNFRRIELKGILSKKYSKYKYSLQGSYTFNGREVLTIKFKHSSKSEEGTIDVFSDNLNIKSISVSGNNVFSGALNRIVRGKVNISFVYYKNRPFVSSVKTYYKKGKLEYWNNIWILMQKNSDFNFTDKEYWAINANDINPLVKYYPKKWIDYKLCGLNKTIIERDLRINKLNLQQQFIQNSGKFFVETSENKNYITDANKFMRRVKKLF